MLLSRRRGCVRPVDDRGATAVLVALLSTLLLMIAALVVDLGIAFTRSAGAEAAARQAAVAAGTALAQDGCAAAVAAAVAALNADANAVVSDTPDVVEPVMVTQEGMVDGDLTNGEMQVLGRAESSDPAASDLLVDATGCTPRPSDPGHLVRIWAPSVVVDFRLAGLFDIDSTTVTGFAGAELRSDLDILPFAIAEECAGPGQRSFVLEPRTVPSPGHQFASDAQLPSPETTFAMELVRLEPDPDRTTPGAWRAYYTNPNTQELWVDFTAVSPSGPVENYKDGPVRRIDTVPGVEGYLPITLPDQVLQEGGDWTVRIGDRPSGNLQWDDGATFPLSLPVTGVVDPGTCQGIDDVGVGDLLLTLPPTDADAPDAQSALERALTVGLSDVSDQVTLMTRAQHQSAESTVSQALLQRLTSEDAPCVPPATGVRDDWGVGTITMAATNRPSCYVNEIAGPGGGPAWRIADAASLQDPRMALVPVVDTDGFPGETRIANPWRPTTSTTITGYRFVFLTDETPDTAAGGGDPPQSCLPPPDATGCSGVTLDGIAVDKITMYVADVDVLPRDLVRVAGAGLPWVGGPADVHLVE